MQLAANRQADFTQPHSAASLPQAEDQGEGEIARLRLVLASAGRARGEAARDASALARHLRLRAEHCRRS